METEMMLTPGAYATHPEKRYDQNKYNRRFIEKNNAKIHEQHTCEVCCGTYTYFNKSKHLKSKKHIDLLNKLRQAELIPAQAED